MFVKAFERILIIRIAVNSVEVSVCLFYICSNLQVGQTNNKQKRSSISTNKPAETQFVVCRLIVIDWSIGELI